MQTRPLRDLLSDLAPMTHPAAIAHRPSCRRTSPHEQMSPQTRRSVPVEVLSHHPPCQPQFLKPTRSPSLLLLPPLPCQLGPTSRSNFLRLKSAVEFWKNAIDSNLGQWHLVWSICHNPTDRSLNSIVYPPHDIPLSTGMCNARTHRSYLYAYGGKRHAHNPQVAHDILWCTHRTDYHPQFVHARRHCVSNSCAVSGGTALRRTELH